MTHEVSRRSLLAASMVGATSILAACGSGDPKSASGSREKATFAASVFGDERNGPLLKQYIKEYNKNAKQGIKPATVPFDTFAQTILTQLSGGLGPDLIRFDTGPFLQAAASGLLQPLDDVIDASKYDLMKSSDRYAVVDGTRYGYVFSVGAYALIYNKDLIKSPPHTWEEFLDVAKEQTTGGRYGTAFRTTLPEQAGMWQDVWDYVYGFGGEWSSNGKLTINSPNVVKGLLKMKELYDAKVIPRGSTAPTYREMFAQGKVAMFIDNSGTAGSLPIMNPKLDIGVVPVPFPVEIAGEVVSICAVNKASENKEAIYKFLKYMLSDAGQEKLQIAQGPNTMATNMERSKKQLKELPFAPVYDKVSTTAVAQIIPGFEALTPDIQKVIIPEIIKGLHGQYSMQKAMDNAQKQAEAIVKKA